MLSPSVDFAHPLSCSAAWCRQTAESHYVRVVTHSLTHSLARSILYSINVSRERRARYRSIWHLLSGCYWENQLQPSRRRSDGCDGRTRAQVQKFMRFCNVCARKVRPCQVPNPKATASSSARHSQGSPTAARHSQAESAFEIQIWEWIADPR